MPDFMIAVSDPQNLPSGTDLPRPTLRNLYQQWLQGNAPEDVKFMTPDEVVQQLRGQSLAGTSGLRNVAVIGAGMAGLCAAIQLQELDSTEVTLFEASGRVGEYPVTKQLSERSPLLQQEWASGLTVRTGAGAGAGAGA